MTVAIPKDRAVELPDREWSPAWLPLRGEFVERDGRLIYRAPPHLAPNASREAFQSPGKIGKND